jgi:hypothetical protein
MNQKAEVSMGIQLSRARALHPIFNAQTFFKSCAVLR